MAQAVQLFDQVRDKASTMTVEFTKKMSYAGDVVYFETGDERDDDYIRRQLACQDDQMETYEALKLLLVRLTQGKDIRRFYPDIVMCLHKSPHETKRLAYLVLAQSQDNEDSQNALMPINMLQKETQVKQPLRRADALKTLTEMSVDEIYPILFGVIKQACYDTNPYVRQTALTGLLKLKDLTSFKPVEYRDELVEVLDRGFKDNSSLIRSQALLVGSVVIEPREAFLDMLHPYFNTIVAQLHLLGHLSIVCNLLKQYSDRYLEPGSKGFKDLVKGVGQAL